MASECLGIKVIFDRESSSISDSRGIGGWKKIVVGPQFFNFGAREQQALLLHEVGHCRMRHLERRLMKLWWLFFKPAALGALCRRQELEADAFVRGCGYGPDLARAFLRIREVPGPMHPALAERISRLTG